MTFIYLIAFMPSMTLHSFGAGGTRISLVTLEIPNIADKCARFTSCLIQGTGFVAPKNNLNVHE